MLHCHAEEKKTRKKDRFNPLYPLKKISLDIYELHYVILF